MNDTFYVPVNPCYYQNHLKTMNHSPTYKKYSSVMTNETCPGPVEAQPKLDKLSMT